MTPERIPDLERALADIQREQRRGFNRLIAATVALFLIVGAAVVAGYVLNENRRDEAAAAARARVASEERQRAALERASKQGRLELCMRFDTLRAREARRAADTLAASRRFLADHPNGTADFSRALIEESITRARRELAELRPLPGRTKSDPDGCYKFADMEPPRGAR